MYFVYDFSISHHCDYLLVVVVCFFFKQKTAYEMRISDWSSDVCSSDLFGTVCFGGRDPESSQKGERRQRGMRNSLRCRPFRFGEKAPGARKRSAGDRKSVV